MFLRGLLKTLSFQTNVSRPIIYWSEFQRLTLLSLWL